MLRMSETKDVEAGGPRSQTSLAYEVIRGDIVAGVHGPGKKLKIQDLAIELKISPGAVREALSRLVPEQLVVSRDQRGFAVAALSIADLEDLTELRCNIEAIALRRSLERGDVNWEAALIAAAHRLRAKPQTLPGLATKPNPEWMASHADFHATLVSACGSPRLLTLHAQLYEQSERYRSLSYYVESTRNVTDEHQGIVDLALARDADGLVAATIRHIRKTTSLIVESARDAGPRSATREQP